MLFYFKEREKKEKKDHLLFPTIWCARALVMVKHYLYLMSFLFDLIVSQ